MGEWEPAAAPLLPQAAAPTDTACAAPLQVGGQQWPGLYMTKPLLSKVPHLLQVGEEHDGVDAVVGDPTEPLPEPLLQKTHAMGMHTGELPATGRLRPAPARPPCQPLIGATQSVLPLALASPLSLSAAPIPPSPLSAHLEAPERPKRRRHPRNIAAVLREGGRQLCNHNAGQACTSSEI